MLYYIVCCSIVLISTVLHCTCVLYCTAYRTILVCTVPVQLFNGFIVLGLLRSHEWIVLMFVNIYVASQYCVDMYCYDIIYLSWFIVRCNWSVYVYIVPVFDYRLAHGSHW